MISIIREIGGYTGYAGYILIKSDIYDSFRWLRHRLHLVTLWLHWLHVTGFCNHFSKDKTDLFLKTYVVCNQCNHFLVFPHKGANTK